MPTQCIKKKVLQNSGLFGVVLGHLGDAQVFTQQPANKEVGGREERRVREERQTAAWLQKELPRVVFPSLVFI